MYYALINDFHTITFLPLFLFLMVYFMKKNTMMFYLSLLLFLSVNQAAPLLLFLFLPYIYWKTRNVNLVLFPALVAVLFMLAAYATMGGILGFQETPLVLPSSVGGLIASLTSNLPAKLTYVLYLSAPLLFLPFLEPLTILPAVGWLGYVFLKRVYFPFSYIQTQYDMIIVGFLFVAFIGSSRRIDSRIVKVGLFVSLIVLAATWSSAGGPFPATDTPYSNPAYQRLNSILSQIPSNATVMASDDVFPHVANSMNTYFTPTFPPQWIVISKTDRNLRYQLPYVTHCLSTATYTIIENDSILFVD